MKKAGLVLLLVGISIVAGALMEMHSTLPDHWWAKSTSQLSVMLAGALSWWLAGKT